MNEQSNVIYEEIQHAVNVILLQLSEHNDGNSNIDEDISSAVDNLTKLHEGISEELVNLRKYSEWNKFVIAFYGETNAGKSTLIEAIRLLFKEESMTNNQLKFKAIQESSGLTQEAFDIVRQRILSLQGEIHSAQKKFLNIDSNYSASLESANDMVTNYKILLDDIINTRSFWKKIVALFSIPKEKIHLIEAEKALVQLKQDIENERTSVSGVLEDLAQQINDAEYEHKRLTSEVEQLTQYADGQIIGDGQSDFTRDNTEYNFSVKGQEFILIDVPGIEGDEAVVKAPICQAISKAHAVFYVTKTPRPPQTHEGDATRNRNGTLEKIKEHLGAQTEIWSIYNHPITSPRMLKAPLIDDALQAGLVAMDEKLKQELDDKYCQNIVLSAKPAFLALTKCVVPGSKDAKDQRKLLEYFDSRDKIYELSGLENFVTQLDTNIISNYKEKIKKSNNNKAYKVLEDSINQLNELNNCFVSKGKQIQDEVNNSQSRIDILLEEFSASLTAAGRKVLRIFHENVERNIYTTIKNNISNEDVKNCLKKEMECESKRLEEGLKASISKNAAEFEVEITKLIQRSNQHLSNIASIQEGALKNSKLNVSIEINNGVQLLGLVSSGVGIVTGIALLASSPVGWTIAFVGGALALVGAIVGVAKSVLSIFNSDYKIAQQNKAAQKSINKNTELIKEGIEKITKSIEFEMRKQIDVVKKEINKPSKQCSAVIQILDVAKVGLVEVAKNIHQ